MLRLVPILLLVLLLLAPACKDKPATTSASARLQRQAVPLPPEVLAEQAEKNEQILDQSGISDERRDALLGELAKQGPRLGFELSEDRQVIYGLPTAGPEGLPVSVAILEIEQAKPVPEDAAEAVKAYLQRMQRILADQQKQEAELQAKLERIDRGEIVGLLEPASDPFGDWRSIGETREGEKHFLVEHDDSYYEVLMLDREDKRITYHKFREGRLERNLSEHFEWDAEKGQLTSSGAGGGPGEAFYLMQLPGIPNRLFARPVYETVFMITVYQRAGGDLETHGIPAPPIADPAK